MNETNEQKETCAVCGDGTCIKCGSCHACKGGVCMPHGGGGWMRLLSLKVRVALIFALTMLALWAGVEAVSGIKAYGYIGSGINPTNTISVQGNGKVFTVPDTAEFSFTISEDGADVGEAQEKVVTKMDDITKYLKDTAGITDNNIQTESYNASPKYEDMVCPVGTYCDRSSKIIGYTVSETVSVKVHDTAKAGEVLSNVGARGVSNVSSLSFVVDDEKLLQEQARGKAILDAQGRAEQLAKDLGVSLTRIVGYYENSVTPYYAKAYGLGGAEMAMDSIAPAPANIQVGQNTIESNVTVTYEIQ